MTTPLIIDGLQYCNWSREIFQQMQSSKVRAVHVTIVYWESCRETLHRIGEWNRRFRQYADLIVHARSAEDVEQAERDNRIAIIFGFQHCSPIEEDIDLIEIFHSLGVRFMQLSYNNQSVMATGCYESDDPGITRFGKQAIAEMNRVGLVVDMSHSAERSTLEAIDLSQRPIAITHANPSTFEPALRNKSDTVLKSLAQSGGMLGLSLYPFHLKDGPACQLEDFCAMVESTVELMGIDQVGLGSDLCQNQPDSVVEWMRNGRWSVSRDFGEGSAGNAGWPAQPEWFEGNADFHNISQGLRNRGFDETDIDKVMGRNWLEFFRKSFASIEATDIG